MAGGKSHRIAASAEQAAKQMEETASTPAAVPQEQTTVNLRSLLPKTPGTKRRVVVAADKPTREVTSSTIPVPISSSVEAGGSSAQGESEKEKSVADIPQQPTDDISVQSPEDEEIKSGDTEVLEEEEVNPVDEGIVLVTSPTVIPD